MYVSVNTDIMKIKAGTIYGSLSELKKEISSITSTVDDISHIWKGNDYNQFSSKMNELTQELIQFEHSLDTYQSFVFGYYRAVESLDDYYKSEDIKLK